MATNINITKFNAELLERAKRQQQNARTRRLTEEANTKLTQTNRLKILEEARKTNNYTASLQPFGRPNVAPQRIIDPAATRVLSTFPAYFIFLKNGGYAKDTVQVSITFKAKVYNALPLIRFATSVPQSYLFLPGNLNIDTFKTSVAWATVSAQIQQLKNAIYGERPAEGYPPSFPTDLRNFSSVSSLQPVRVPKAGFQSITTPASIDVIDNQHTQLELRATKIDPNSVDNVRAFCICGLPTETRFTLYECYGVFQGVPFSQLFSRTFPWGETAYTRNPANRITGPTRQDPFPYGPGYPFLFRPDAPYLLP